MNLVDDTNMIYSFKSNHVKFIAKNDVAWTLDGEYGGEHAEVEVRNLQQAISIIAPQKEEIS